MPCAELTWWVLHTRCPLAATPTNLQGALKVGDELTAINGRPQRGIGKSGVIAIMKESVKSAPPIGGKQQVTLTIKRES